MMLSVQGLPLPPFSVQSLLHTPQGKSPSGGWEVLGWVPFVLHVVLGKYE